MTDMLLMISQVRSSADLSPALALLAVTVGSFILTGVLYYLLLGWYSRKRATQPSGGRTSSAGSRLTIAVVPDAMKNRLGWILVICTGVGGYIGGLAVAGALSNTSLASLGGFFTAAAAVLGAVLIALALGATIADPASPLARLLLAVVGSVVVGLVASVAGLAPGLSHGAERQLFAFTTAAGLVSLIGILLVAFTAVFLPPVDRDAAWRQRLAERGVPTPTVPNAEDTVA